MKLGLFPGQGIEAKALLEHLDARDPLVKTATEYLSYDLVRRVEVVARGSASALPTVLAQPAIFVASVSSWMRREEHFDMLLGHSLGEYAALVAGEAISFEHALATVAVRAEAMERAARSNPGGMAAVIGMDRATAEVIAEATGVVLANDNGPGQVVLSGSEEALARAASQSAGAGARVVRLAVSGPFHSHAMAPVAAAVRDALDHCLLRSPTVPVLSNVTALPYRAPGEIRALLIRQPAEQVRFRECLQWCWDRGADSWDDLGPGNVVGVLARRAFQTFRQPEAARA